MKFAIEHTFRGVSLADYEALFFDEPFNVALGEAIGLGRTLLTLERTDGRIVRKVRCQPAHDPAHPHAKKLAESRAAFVDEVEYDARTKKAVFRTIPNLLPEKVKTVGEIAFVEVPGGVRREVRGEVNVKIFAVGGFVERSIVAEIEKSYVRAAAFTEEWLSRRRAT
jgi:hypothetical protein